jgi:type IV pilus assembly protein PilW
MKNIARAPQQGFSIMELMISITIGLLLLTGLASLFSKSSTSQNEIRRAAAQIENGRYAMDTMTQDLQLAGFLGEYRMLTAPATIPDPCSVAQADVKLTLNLPVFGYPAPSLTTKPTVPATCYGAANEWLSSANLQPGSDVLVISRAETNSVALGTPATSGMWYVQVNPATLDLQGGTGANIGCFTTADGTTITSITRRCLIPAASDPCGAAPTACPTQNPGGYIRKVHIHIYYVSPCNVQANGSTCTSTDDGGRPIPTLKRLELTGGGGVTTFQVSAIAEGVEFMKIGYGIDDTAAVGCSGSPCVNADTGLVGDGAPDRYVLAPSASDLANVVAVRLDLLVRNPEPSFDFVDTKTYKLGSDPTTPTNPAYTIVASTDLASVLNYRRHVYNGEIRLVNLSSRKENP